MNLTLDGIVTDKPNLGVFGVFIVDDVIGALINVIKKDYVKQGTTIVYATSSEKLAESLATKVVKLKDGVIEK